MRFLSIVGAIVAVVLAVMLGCGPKTTIPPVDSSVPPPCAVLWPLGDPVDTVTVALFDTVDPSHAPVPRNNAERIVFHHLYETLVPAPALCPTSSRLVASVSAGETTTFSLSGRARFWDGSAVTAQSVVLAWDRYASHVEGTAVVRDDHRIEISGLPDRLILAAPVYAIAKPSDGRWPGGTGRYRVDANDDLADGSIVLSPAFGNHDPVIRFVDRSGVDARDVLEAGDVDVVVVKDRATADYASGLPNYGNVLVSSTRAYLLVAVTRAIAIEHGDSLPKEPGMMSGSLALNAVRSTYSVTFPRRAWELAVNACNLPARAMPSVAPLTRRILYDTADGTARDLAERLSSLGSKGNTSPDAVALGRAIPDFSSDLPPLAAVGVTADELSASLAAPSDFAYVVAIDFDKPRQCASIEGLCESAPWLGGGFALGDELIPLVRSVTYAFVARSSRGYGFDLQVDEAGNFLVVGCNSEQP